MVVINLYMQPENKHGNSVNPLNGSADMNCDTDFSSQLFPKRANQTTNPILKSSSTSSPAQFSNPISAPTPFVANEPTVIPSSRIQASGISPNENPKSRKDNYYLLALKKYAVFSGRSRRAEYWYFTLFIIIISIILTIVSLIVGDELGIIGMLYALAIIVPSLAVSVRRLHDIGKSGWMLLITLIPFIGAIWLLVLMVTDSDVGDNNYGPNPKLV